MKQSEIWLANLNPGKDSEQSGMRPVVIISGNLLNQYMPVIIVCPLSSKIKNYKGNLVLEPTVENGLSESSEVLTFQIHSVTKDRLLSRLGSISQAELSEIKGGLDDILRY
jgi:mRNA interferase MazF